MSGPERTAAARTEAKRDPDGILSTPGERLTGARHAGVVDADAGRAALTTRLLSGLAPDLGFRVGDARVRVDAEAARRTGSRGARGLMTDGVIWLHPDRYDPASGAGRSLLAHEATHLAQRSLRGPRGDRGGGGIAAAEAEAAQVAADFAADRALTTPTVALPASAHAADTGHFPAQPFFNWSVANPPAPTGASTPWGRLINKGPRAGRSPAPPQPTQFLQILNRQFLPMLNQDPVTAALALMQKPTADLVEKNTAQAIRTGRVHYVYYEDLDVPDNAAELLAERYPDPAERTKHYVYTHPVTGEALFPQKSAEANRFGDLIIVSRLRSVAEVRRDLVHEVNHALGPVFEDASIQDYRGEFQAFWVAGYANSASSLDERARRIRAHILSADSYSEIQDRYKNDPVFKALVDTHTRPEGNVLNSLRYAAVIAALSGSDDDAQAVYQAIRLMSPEEKKAARGSAKFLTALQDLTGYERQKAYLLLFGYPEHAVAALDAMAPLGTDEGALFRNLAKLSAAERSLVRGDRLFMMLLEDELSRDDLERARRILAGGDRR